MSVDASNQQTLNREINGLVDAITNLKLKKGTLVTANKSETPYINKLEINTIPLWRWLLEQ